MGRLIQGSQVDALGLHLHPVGQPYLNLTIMVFSSASGMKLGDPVMKLYRFESPPAVATKKRNETRTLTTLLLPLALAPYCSYQ